ncbi:15764_t:CDS:2, partial [Acaulospora colombiana]
AALENPTWVQWVYITSLVVQTGDSILFWVERGFPMFAPSTGNITPFSRVLLRAYASMLFPFKLTAFLLRHYHIRDTDVGFTIGSCFALAHTMTLVAYGRGATTVGRGGIRLEPFAGIMLAHSIWAGEGVDALKKTSLAFPNLTKTMYTAWVPCLA